MIRLIFHLVHLLYCLQKKKVTKLNNDQDSWHITGGDENLSVEWDKHFSHLSISRCRVWQCIRTKRDVCLTGVTKSPWKRRERLLLPLTGRVVALFLPCSHLSPSDWVVSKLVWRLSLFEDSWKRKKGTKESGNVYSIREVRLLRCFLPLSLSLKYTSSWRKVSLRVRETALNIALWKSETLKVNRKILECPLVSV